MNKNFGLELKLNQKIKQFRIEIDK